MLSMLLFCTVVAAPGQGSVFADIADSPGYPEGIVLDRGNVYVTTPARFGTAGTCLRSEILVFQHSTGTLQSTIVVEGEDLDLEHALSAITVDQQGRLYVLSTQLGVLRFYRSGEDWVQEQYAMPLWPLEDGGYPLPNDAVFDETANLYVSDSAQGAIWRIPPGGGVPEVWLEDERLESGIPGQLGVNGVRPDPSREWLYMAVSTGLSAKGMIFRAQLQDPSNPESPAAALDETFSYTYDPGEIPDGLAFTNGGLLYVVLAGANAVSVLDVAQGIELDRLDGPEGSTIPFVQPANLVFDSSTVLVTNHAVFAQPPAGLFAVLEMEVAHLGDAVPAPIVP